MRDTIKSSWEMVDYVFQIEGVTRVFTHQLVRTRTGSYAQQAMRVVDARDFPIQKPHSVSLDNELHWDRAVEAIRSAYTYMVENDVPAQDARGILPNNVQTKIFAKINLRTLQEMAKLLLCTRTQGEYQDVFREMRRLVVEAHPWAEEFIEVHCAATGTCAFPRYGKAECPVYLPAMDNTAVRDAARSRFWNIRHEAAPVAKDGKAM
jgi:flavin-dependent thymidylate synthase